MQDRSRMTLCAAALFLAVFAASPEARAEDPAARGASPQPPAASAPAVDVDALIKALASDDAKERYDAAAKAKDVQDAKLLKPLAAALKDDIHEVRVAVMEALGARTGAEDRKAAAAALHKVLGPLSKKADYQPELLVALRAVHDLAQPSSVKPLLEDIDVHTDREVVDARLMAVANIPTPDAIDALIQFMSRGRKGGEESHRASVQKALLYATGERQRNDPDAWRAWWKDARKTFDFEAAAENRNAAREKQDRRNEKRQGKGGKGEGKDGKGRGEKDGGKDGDGGAGGGDDDGSHD